MEKTVCFDFDGVIHSYKSGWKGIAIIPDPPVEGIQDVILRLRNDGYTISIYSTRCANSFGKAAIATYCRKNGIYYDQLDSIKPPAVVYVDDRGLNFDGKTDGLVKKIKNFHSWIEKPEQL